MLKEEFEEKYLVVTWENITWVIPKQGCNDDHAFIGHWAKCIGCDRQLCVFEYNTQEGQDRAEIIMQDIDAMYWWFVDGTWLCNVCM